MRRAYIKSEPNHSELIVKFEQSGREESGRREIVSLDSPADHESPSGKREDKKALYRCNSRVRIRT